MMMMMTVEYSSLFRYGDQPASSTEALKMSASSVHYNHLQRYGVAMTHLCISVGIFAFPCKLRSICSRVNGISKKAIKLNKTSVLSLCFPKRYESYRLTNIKISHTKSLQVTKLADL